MHPSDSWDHLAVKLKAKIKLLEVVPYNTDNEAQGSPLVPAVGKGEGRGKGKGKMLVTQVLPCQIEGGYSVYNPKMLNGEAQATWGRKQYFSCDFGSFLMWLTVLQ